ncbi:ABC transporter permease subunit [Parashewanella tropica]|uniref:ABC transporter permease subunit n=1 Tax=Parashewanella tropica TaxID=2547970 RepID=UPI001059BDC6|nr:ABC transporter permease subunit [Parashewanella tropica]
MESQVTPPDSKSLLLRGVTSRRTIKDKATQIGVSIGGTMVFVALLLIFFYLLYVIKPVFDSATMTQVNTIDEISDKGTSLMVGSDEQNEVVYRVTQSGEVQFYNAASGKQVLDFTPNLPAGVTVVSSSRSMPDQQMFALGLSNGEALLFSIKFGVSYPNNVRTITPEVSYPAGEAPLVVSESGEPIEHIAFAYNPSKISILFQNSEKQFVLKRFEGEENMITEEVEWVAEEAKLTDTPNHISKALITPYQRQLMLMSDDKVFVYDIRYMDETSLFQVINLERANAHVTDIQLLSGASSIMVSYDSGDVEQYFQVASDKGRLYQRIRGFDNIPPVSSMTTEFFRKSFVVGSPDGTLTLLYTTSHRELLSESFKIGKTQAMGFNPRSDGLVVEADGKLHLFKVDNPHPEVSWSALWEKVWYEGYPEPKFVWQSTSGSDDFEAKLSLMPLAFGTMKAAFYAMLFAVPLAIAGAIYTAYFMSSKIRGVVKPTIEIMEALPTVILGFLAGLWLAPLFEENLPGIVILLILLPTSVLASAFGWSKLPRKWKNRLPETYQELMLIPVICFVGWFSFAISPTIEIAFFGGDMRSYITNDLGIPFDQRNAMVVGIAMGFAVIPTIFSIAEDAIFSVPRHLSNGSLALGATQWQTLTRVVLLTASPGIFSAVMMGLGRAVGETMIVLMATGNTAIMDWSIFEGMRTLAANIAVEMPESAIGSSHYRVLFLAAFVLFVFTFFFNTIAEVVRQRLRDKYSSL